jgi:hypothetical protein
MKPWIVCAAIAVLGVSGCAKPVDWADESRGAPHGKGRYIGVGLYHAGRMWAQVVDAEAPKDAAASRAKDDEEIVIVLDSSTGELRQCGNLSGACIAMNPWAKPLVAPRQAPVLLNKHAEQLDAEAEANARKARPN